MTPEERSKIIRLLESGAELRPNGPQCCSRLKSAHTVSRITARIAKKLSYADCFAAALAKMSKAELISGDDEFTLVESEIKIAWLR
jgi:uncharacterized protein with PIN domain